MADIIAFRGTRYDPTTAGELGKLISPPYDVINTAMRQTLMHSSEYNIAHIIKAARADGANPYEATAALWSSWKKHGIFRHDATPAIYVYEQHFEVHGRKFYRTGMIVLTRLEKLGEGVLPHEETLAAARADRLDLLRATKTNFGLVLALYNDAENNIDATLEQAKAGHPLLQIADRDKQLHRLWAMTDPETIAGIQKTMQDKTLLIADGHHRYETALAFGEQHPNWRSANYRMMALVNTANVGLVVLPTHRLVKNLAELDHQTFLAGLRRAFDIRPYPGDMRAVRAAVLDIIKAEQKRGRHALGLFMGDGKFYVLLLRSKQAMIEVTDHSEAWCDLDVSILHHCILERLMGITPEKIGEEAHVEYVQDFPHAIQDATDRVMSGNCQALFLLNPTRMTDIMAVARSGERMPQKSTFFYPKVYTGLVFNCLEA